MQKFLIALFILTLSTSAASREPGYNFIQAGYTSVTDSSTGTDVDGDNVAISGSFDVFPGVAFTASYGMTGFDDFLGYQSDAKEYELGITAYKTIVPGTDIGGNLSMLHVDVEASNGLTTLSDRETGNIISLLLRHIATDRIEIDIAVKRVDIFDDTKQFLVFGARIYAGDSFSIGISMLTGDDAEHLTVTARMDI